MNRQNALQPPKVVRHLFCGANPFGFEFLCFFLALFSGFDVRRNKATRTAVLQRQNLVCSAVPPSPQKACDFSGTPLFIRLSSRRKGLLPQISSLVARMEPYFI